MSYISLNSLFKRLPFLPLLNSPCGNCVGDYNNPSVQVKPFNSLILVTVVIKSFVPLFSCLCDSFLTFMGFYNQRHSLGKTSGQTYPVPLVLPFKHYLSYFSQIKPVHDISVQDQGFCVCRKQKA